ncbi:MAG: efflux RND transporter periplasmic adaptor subunit [Gemmatimonadaceae bacterium]
MTTTRNLTALLIGVAACAGEAPPANEPPPVTVAIATQAAGISGETRYGGAIEPDVSVDVAFRVNGIVEAVSQRSGIDGRPRALQDGDVVRRGTTLARLRQDEYRDQLSDAEAGFQQSRADYERASQLYENRSISKAEYDAAFARFAAGGARRNQAAVSLHDATLHAPIDGIVLKRTAEVGALAGPSVAAFTIADTRVVKVVFGVPDVAVAQLKLGGRLAIEAEALPGKLLEGRITRIAPSADRSSRVFEVAASLPNTDGRLKVGMLATLRLGGTAAAPNPVVPLASIVRPLGDTTSYAVYVVHDSTKDTSVARRTRVTLGPVSGNLIAVTSGLNAGDRVVVRGATLVADGQPIRVIR